MKTKNNRKKQKKNTKPKPKVQNQKENNINKLPRNQPPQIRLPIPIRTSSFPRNDVSPKNLTIDEPKKEGETGEGEEDARAEGTTTEGTIEALEQGNAIDMFFKTTWEREVRSRDAMVGLLGFDTYACQGAARREREREQQPPQVGGSAQQVSYAG